MTPLVSFGHCVVRPSSIYGFWWPLWYLLIIVLSVLLRSKDTKGVIKSRKSKKDGQHNDQKIPKGSSKAVNRRRTDNAMTKRYQRLCCSSFFDLRLLMTPLVSFGHCVVRPSSIYGFWWPRWYLLVIVLSVILRFTKDGQHNDQKIPKGSSKAVNRRRTNNTMTKRSQRGHQKP
jgi:hypothetical protein